MSAEIVSVLTGVAGIVVGFFVYRVIAAKQLENIKKKTKEVNENLETKHKELILQAKDEALKIKEDAKREEEHRRSEAKEIEQNLRRREEAFESRLGDLEKERKAVIESEKEIRSFLPTSYW